MLNALTKVNEQVCLAPEDIELVSIFVESGYDHNTTAQVLGWHPHDVKKYLERPNVKGYITTLAVDSAVRHSSELSNKLDDIIATKLQELLENEITSSKDIADLLQMQHKMRMDQAKLAIEVAKASQATSVRNTQVNIGGTGYEKLVAQLING